MTSRNAVFAALFALTDNLDLGTAGAAGFVTRSRKFQHFGKVDAEQQPALFQTEHTEQSAQRTGMASLRRWHTSWTVYLRSNPGDLSDEPTTRVNDIIDALEAALAPPPGWQGDKQTLGGLVDHVFIDGTTIKIPGDDDGQGMIVVPLTLLVP